MRGSSVRLGLRYATRDDAVCSLSDYTPLQADAAWGSVADMHASYIADAGAGEDITVTGEMLLHLPTGRAGRAELAWDDGTRAVRYSFTDGDTWLALFCLGDPLPDDRWLSLAQSLAWLAPDSPA